MGSAIQYASFLLILLIPFSLCFPSNPSKPREDPVVPTPWPHQFHSILFINRSGSLEKVDLWYDWPKGRNFNIIQHQLGKLAYDLEWNNGTSFIYTLGSDGEECRVLSFEVGILRPNWLDGADYLGQRYMDGFLCNVWEKADFIWYYEDVASKRPVYWLFFSGAAVHVMTFEVGRVLEDSRWQAPVYCFEKTEDKKSRSIESVLNVGPHSGLMMRGEGVAIN